MYSERMMQNRLKKMKNEFKEHIDKRNEYIIDKIFEGNSIVLGPEDLIKYLKEVENLKIEAMRFEGKLTGYMFSIFEDKREFHTLYFVEKNEDLRKFMNKVTNESEFNTDNYIGFSIYNDKDMYGILGYDLKNEMINRDNVKKAIERLLPSADASFNSVVNDSVQQFTERMMLENLMSIAEKNKKRAAK